MEISDFDYELPVELIAQYPLPGRDESRLMVLNRGSGEVRETRFVNFTRYLQEGDLLVINETRVIPARIFGRRRTGGRVEVFLVRKVGDRQWSAMLRPAKRNKRGEEILVGRGGYPIRIVGRIGGGEWRISLPESISEDRLIHEHGHVPLPPYIRRSDEDQDRRRYQTIFASRNGSVAAPTAGLHFTDEILNRTKRKGVTIIPLTLHVGPGTFRPLRGETVEENVLSPEFIQIRSDYWREIEGSRGDRRRIVAVGTTTTRALESLAIGYLSRKAEKVLDGVKYVTGWTDLFIYPGFTFKVVDALLTNLHLPRSSNLLLVAAFAGRENTMRAYHWAVKRAFRFYSFGDVMFIR